MTDSVVTQEHRQHYRFRVTRCHVSWNF